VYDLEKRQESNVPLELVRCYGKTLNLIYFLAMMGCVHEKKLWMVVSIPSILLDLKS
jgi:hypothetical protein